MSAISRRKLLAAGAGLVVGAGVTGAATELGGSHSSTGRRAASPSDTLMTEHGVLKRLLLAYQSASAQLAVGTVPPAAAIGAAAAIIADYIEGFHEGLEEAYVFPRIRPTHTALVETLLVQHDRGRHLTAAISEVTAGGLSTAASRMTLRGYLDQFITMYAPHEAWEDTVAFPALVAVTSQATLDDLARRFADLERARYGPNALPAMLGRVSGIEQQLGIGDLAAFTPPPV